MSKEKTKSLGGKFSVEKKSAFLSCRVRSKNILSLSAGKILHRAIDFLPSKESSIYFVLTLDPVQIRRNFFPLGNPPYAKKSKRDSLYFDLLPGPFKSANSFLLIVQLIKDNEVEAKSAFVCKFIYLTQSFINK